MAQQPLLERGIPPWDPDAPSGGELPEGAYAREVAFLSLKDRRSLANTAGPGVKYAAWGVMLHSLLWLLTPLAEYALAECPEEGYEGIVAVPRDLLTLVGYVFLFAPFHLYCQNKCMRYVIIPQLEVTGRFLFMGLPVQRLGYWTWHIMFSALTCGATLNTLTNGQILGRTLATFTCGGPYQQLEVTWKKVMGEAVIHQIPGFRTSSFLRVSVFAYLLHLVTPLFAWIYARPTAPHQIDYAVQHGEATRYRTPYNYTKTNHGSVVMVLGSLARFEAVTFQDVTYATARIEELSKQQDPDWGEILEIARAELDRAIARFAIIAMLQDAIQTNLQTSMVGIDWSLATGKSRHRHELFGGLDLQMFISVVLCFMSTVSDLLDAIDVLKITHSVSKRLPLGQVDHLSLKVQVLLKHVKRKLVRFAFYMFIFLGMSLWSFAKVVALFVCQKHLWNFHPGELFWDASFSRGCA
mmetsp:Transcript_126834/g.370822  ORF Transcript_126834/g.370822 Transcript_126834/m.370822 type:complete len:467 (-) Transcript_126834:102-1502(-)